MGEIGAFDDFKYGRVNMARATRTPIKWPTRGHIAQLFLDARASDRLCIAALRCPEDSKRCGFLPMTLLSGAAAEVLHYNCFSRIVAVIANNYFGLPAANYFDDFGFPLLGSISRPGLRAFRPFPTRWASCLTT